MGLVLERRLVKQADIAWKIVDGEAVLIDEREAELIRLNLVGTTIWNAIDGRRTVREIIEDVGATFDVSEQRTARDVRRFVRRLLRYELVKEVSDE